MNWVDLVNAAFIVGASVFTWGNVIALWHAREVRGASVGLFAFFVGWGTWQVYFYASLAQWWSVAGTLPLLVGNLVWVGLAVYWRRHRST